MILGFKQQFVQPILSGTKMHTIREDLNDRWHAGRVAQFATGVRTKNYKQFDEREIVSTQRIFITAYDEVIVSINSKRLGLKELETLAINDGFDTLEQFEDFFINQLSKRIRKQMSGKIIHWTDFKY